MDSLIRCADRVQRIAPFYAMHLLARAKQLESQGRDIIHMEIGEPDFACPEPIALAGIEAIRNHQTRYTPASGIVQLKEAIAQYYQQQFGISVAPHRIIITPGASGALLLTLALLVDTGQQVLMTDPGYPCNRHFVELIGGSPVPISVDSSTDYQLSLQHIMHHWNAQSRCVMLSSPSNPTGHMIEQSVLKSIHRWLQANAGVLIMDEIYQGLVYDEPSQTALSIGSDVFVVNSFSKFFGMTGWRLGWLVAPDAAVGELEKLCQNVFIAPTTPSQYAALAAFQSGSLEILAQRREILRKRRDFLYQAISDSLGFSLEKKPSGAFYLYADVSAYCDDSFAFCTQLLNHTGVAITPGKDFGVNGTDKRVRFAYTASIDRLEEAVTRIHRFLHG